MPALLKQRGLDGLDVAIDERQARLQLRRQIARLEAELATRFGDGFGRTEVPHRIDALAAAPRVLDLGELEAVRDSLADRIAVVVAARILADPGAVPLASGLAALGAKLGPELVRP